MVARPSLKRVVPGSVPPWRALCASRVSTSALLLEPKFGQAFARAKHARFLVRASWPRPRRSFGGLVSVSEGGPGLGSSLARALRQVGARRSFCGFYASGSVPPARACFSWPRRSFGLPGNVCRGRAVVFHFRQSKKPRRPLLRLIGSLSTFAVETLFALHCEELPSWRGVLQLS